MAASKLEVSLLTGLALGLALPTEFGTEIRNQFRTARTYHATLEQPCEMFEEWLCNEYGITFGRDEHDLITRWDIVDNNKFLMFKLKFQ